MTPSDTLRTRFAQARASGLRARNAAEAIGVSEGQAIAAHAGPHDQPLRAVPLRTEWLAILQALESCGPVMALTRNESTVHEKTGVYRNLSATGPVGLAVGEDIDLRLFFMHWHAGFAVTEVAVGAAAPAALSLQFYDAAGLAVHKVFCKSASDRPAFEAVMQRFAAPELQPTFGLRKPRPAPLPDGAIDAAAFIDAWGAMQDTHDFFGLLQQHKVERQQGLRLAQGRFTRRAPASAVRTLLQEASRGGEPIMVFVGSPGCIQIHTGPVRRVEPREIAGQPWLNVLDPGFNLHLREDAIAQVWVVCKPTTDGTVTSLEAFDQEGELIAMFFGARKPGEAERDDWRALVAKAAPESAAAEAA
ncbi:ChuX/HutX family heme-like substrate-binding protein [Melaminivora sp.]|uniref:hemin-degrading factor n=1 Tax=Melaminivora sp. TaxID=1933032 RepID=UPI0028AE93DD|nr:ChuX/HutX family heme-like substrate-binding protein [Melaminivora sp.]